MSTEEQLESAHSRLAALQERETVLWKILDERGIDLLQLKQEVRDRLLQLHSPHSKVEAQAEMLKYAFDKILPSVTVEKGEQDAKLHPN